MRSQKWKNNSIVLFLLLDKNVVLIAQGSTNMKSYQDLKIYSEAFQLALDIRTLSFTLNQPDRFEVGSQIRRSSQSIKDNIVEGYGRRRYKADFIRFLVFAHSSLLEAKSQADFLAICYPEGKWENISKRLEKLGSRIHNFISYVNKNWKKM